jgi:hypothetical protein
MGFNVFFFDLDLRLFFLLERRFVFLVASSDESLDSLSSDDDSDDSDDSDELDSEELELVEPSSLEEGEFLAPFFLSALRLRFLGLSMPIARPT